MTGDDPRAATLAAIRASLSGSDAVGTDLDPVAPPGSPQAAATPAERFRERLESVGGHVVLATSEEDAVAALRSVLDRHPGTVAISDAASVADLVARAAPERTVVPPGATRDALMLATVGVTTAQRGIAETGTLVLDGARERHRLTSLVPSIHVALLATRDLVDTLDDALRELGAAGTPSAAITFVTGPSRTADIELTLVVGVHGPQELHVILLENAIR